MITAEQAKELLAAATPGPWEEGERQLGRTVSVWAPNSSTPQISVADRVFGRDSALIAAAPDLAQTVMDLTERVENARELLENWHTPRADRIIAALDGDQPKPGKPTCPHGRTRCACLPNYGEPT